MEKDENLVSKRLVAEAEVLPREKLLQRICLINAFIALLLGAFNVIALLIGAVAFVYDLIIFWQSKKREKMLKTKYDIK